MTEKPLDDDDMTTSTAGAGSEGGSADGVDAGPGPDTGPMDTADADGSDSDSADGVDAGEGPDTGPKDSGDSDSSDAS
jgi:hypothetical protein